LDSDPEDQRIVNNLGLVYGYQGKEDLCLHLFRQVNTEAEALANVGFILSQTGDNQKAQSYFHRALELDPTLKTAAVALLEYDQAEKSGK
ncbi:MAG: tetratricopeptide repeat protein, partial [Planctomycetales bacterium]|nr:tetratricopeptide repeat protein [Planctomycetales bacterium]